MTGGHILLFSESRKAKMDDEFDLGLKSTEDVAKKKFKTKTKREDPLQFHAKPRDLDAALNAQSIPMEQSSETSDKIFSSVSFSSLTLDKKLVATIERPESEGGMGMARCTNIQSIVYPNLLEKRQNMLIKSQTGSGKTMAYLVPVINDLMSITPKIDRAEGCRTLIMAPTRELCTQIAEVLEKLTKCCVWVVGGCITGGERRKSEKGRLRKGIVVLVGTPGRLLDHLSSTESFLLTKLRWVVLDEVDRLLDMGKRSKQCFILPLAASSLLMSNVIAVCLFDSVPRVRADGTADSEHPERRKDCRPEGEGRQ